MTHIGSGYCSASSEGEQTKGVALPFTYLERSKALSTVRSREGCYNNAREIEKAVELQLRSSLKQPPLKSLRILTLRPHRHLCNNENAKEDPFPVLSPDLNVPCAERCDVK